MNWELSWCIVGTIWGLAFMYRSKKSYDIEKMTDHLSKCLDRLDKLENK